MGFVHDQLAKSKMLRILTAVDIRSRQCPAADLRFVYRGEDVVQTLKRIYACVGYQKMIWVENGGEFFSRELDTCVCANNVIMDVSQPGKPTDKSIIETFYSKLRAECLNTRSFTNFTYDRRKMDAWRREYNEVRPQSAIGYSFPITPHFPDGAASPSS